MSRAFTRDFLLEVEKGNVAGHTLIRKFGRNDGVPNNSWEFVNELGFTAWPLSAATTVRVKAGDAADTAGGNGAREITVEGIDSNFNEITEAIATAGASASSVTSASFWRIHRAWVSACGTYGAANTAAVVIENGAGGTDLIGIAVEEGQSQFGGYTIPIGKTGYLLSMHIHVDTKKIANIRVFTRDDIDDTTAPMKSKRIKLYFDGLADNFRYSPQGPEIKILQKSDVWVEAYGDAAVAEVSVNFEILLVDN